jgi:anti-anti-sigma factor
VPADMTPMRACSSIEVDSSSPGVSIVALRGEHDVNSWTDVVLALAPAGARLAVLVDLSECTFMDSTVITALLVASKQLGLRGGALEVVIAPGENAIRRTLQLMSVGALLSIHETRAAGIASLEVKALLARKPHAA